jgi:hypothetical protein
MTDSTRLMGASDLGGGAKRPPISQRKLGPVESASRMARGMEAHAVRVGTRELNMIEG